MDRIDITQALQDTDRNFKEQGMFKQFFNQREEENDSANDDVEEEQKAFSEFLNEEVQ